MIEPEGPERLRIKRGPRGGFIGFISGVPLGIALLSILFVYASVGSAGIVYPILSDGGLAWKHDMIRQWRVFELTEFEWFHTWFFIGLCAAICINLTLATVLRIPFNALKAGVWMIHGGIIIMSIGSVIYFGTKVEGDAPVIRRQVAITMPDGAEISMPALTGVQKSHKSDGGEYSFEVFSILPQYELLSGDLKGTQDFAVTVRVTQPDGSVFFRQLLANHPQYTEDSIEVDPSMNGGRPMQRVRNLPQFGGEALVRDDLVMGLEYLPQDSFWIKDSWALHLREVGSEEWIERPIRNLPRYNDYIPQITDIWASLEREYPVMPLNIAVRSASDADPLAGEVIRIHGYLRYAVEQERFVSGGDEFNPLLDLQLLTADGQRSNFQLLALDPIRRTGAEGNLGFFWAEDEEQYQAILDDAGPARLEFTVRGADGESVTVRERIVELELEQAEPTLKRIGDTGWQYRVQSVANDLEIRTGIPSNFAIVEIFSPQGDRIVRYAATNPRETRDIDASAEPPYVMPDPRIEVLYSRVRMPAISFVGREGDPNFTMVERLRSGGVRQQTIRRGDSIDLGGGNELRLTRFSPNAVAERKPVIVPEQQRNADVDRSHHYAMVKVAIGEQEIWLPFHKYTEMSESLAAAGLTRYEPTVFTLEDGRSIEVMFGRQRRDLPAPVVLEEFILTSHIGGFTGETSQIRNWTSDLKFVGDDGTLVRKSVSVNKPSEFGDLWYFQSFWDAPRVEGGRQTSAGMAFTGLGIGNREGVWTALIGSTLSVIGMIYTFYVKPIIKRRRRERVLAGLAQTQTNGALS